MPYIGNQPGTGVRSRFIYTATASQTTFSGADNNSKTLSYADSNYIDVYLNGVCLVPGTDYTASTKTSVVLTQAASLGDTLKVIAYDVASMDDSISQSAGGTFEAAVAIRTADNTTQLTLESTDADANSGPVLELYRNSASPADDDVLGEIEFHGENDADEKIQYGLIAAKLQDASDGTEDVRLSFKTITAGTERERVTIQPTEVVINEDSQDLDFRVESDNKTNMLFVDGENDRIGVGITTPSSMLHLFDGGTDTGITIQSAASANATSSVTLMSRLADNSNKTCSISNNLQNISIAGDGFKTKLGINTNAPAEELVVQGTINQECEIMLRTDGGVNCSMFTANPTADHALGFKNNGTENFRIASNGDLTATDTTISSNSDERLKKDITDFEYDLATFKKYNAKKFNWKQPQYHGDRTNQIGFIAQELSDVDSQWVSTSTLPSVNLEEHPEAQYLDEDLSVFTAKLGQTDAMYISVIQQLISKIETLETKVAALEAE